MKKITKVEKKINMNIDAEIWKKVGLLSATEDATKRSIVEKAIDLYYQQANKE